MILTSLVAATLHLVYPAPSVSPSIIAESPVAVEFHQTGSDLYAEFTVKASSINAKAELGPTEYPYQFDVVELFVSVDGSANHWPYYEIEVSPLNQDFEVKIKDAKHHIDHFPMNVRHTAERTPEGWKVEMIIPLDELGWSGDPKDIVGNAFAVLGQRPQRTYWSLSLPPETKPNFHRPEFFQPLLK